MKKTIKHLEKQIISIAKIKKITTAMKIIATIKTKKTSQKINNTLNRQTAINEVFATVSELAKSNIIKKKLASQKNKKNLWIAFTSDLGLCGSFNSKLLNLLSKSLTNQDKLILIGIKASKYFASKSNEILKSFSSQEFLNQGLKWIIMYLKDNFLNYKKINLIHHQYQPALPIPVIIYQLNPIIVKPNQTQTVFLEKFVLENEPWTLFLTTLPFYWESLLTLLFWNSRASEEKTRQFAMENASKNANDIVKDLKLQFNRLRQEKITKEILLVSQED